MKGVEYTTPLRHKPWRARIMRNGKLILDRYFESEKKAITAARFMLRRCNEPYEEHVKS